MWRRSGLNQRLPEHTFHVGRFQRLPGLARIIRAWVMSDMACAAHHRSDFERRNN